MIEEQRRRLGDRLLILGHHYQRQEVLEHVDFTGDSLELARYAARQRQAGRIVFCGVRFMAETADILTSPEQAVYMPESSALCPMADMADETALEAAYLRLSRVAADWAPVVYVNSTAEVKAFCGRRGGSACTSGNARAVFEHYLRLGRRILFAPDEHLGVNTAGDLGLSGPAVAVYDPAQPEGGLSDHALAPARIVVWKGFCHVHTNFTVEQVERVRRELPQARVIVHPETPREVVRLSDAHGSTAEIIRYVDASPEGSVIVIGTELNLVRRLAQNHAGRRRILALSSSLCPNMAKTHVSSLAGLLENWPEHQRVRVAEPVAGEARVSLEKMLDFS